MNAAEITSVLQGRIRGFDRAQHLRLGETVGFPRFLHILVDRIGEGRYLDFDDREGARFAQLFFTPLDPGRGRRAAIERLGLPLGQPVSFDDDLRMISGRAILALTARPRGTAWWYSKRRFRLTDPARVRPNQKPARPK